jgi:4-aminobutyrate aminotransferase
MKKAYEVYVEDASGKRYIDFTAGASTVVGYSHPRVIEAVVEQARRGMDHTQSDLSMGVVEIRSELVEEIKKFVPQKLANGKVVFGHSGSDIIERAIRLVRFATNRPTMISYFQAHHGASACALSASPNLKEMGSQTISQFFQLPGFLYMPFPDPYRPWFGGESDAGTASLAFLERLLSSVISPELVAGVLVEPIQSAAGTIVPPDGYFERLARICREHRLPLVADEVLTGMGKTGHMFALEHWHVWPDVLCLGKALSDSLPLSMLLADDNLASQWNPKDYASMSKDGYLLGCAVSLAILEIIREENLISNARRMGDYLMKRLRDLKTEQRLAGQIRGLGLVVGFDLVESEGTKKPASKLAERALERALKRGLIIASAGANHNVLCFEPALTINEQQIDDAIEILYDVFGGLHQ